MSILFPKNFFKVPKASKLENVTLRGFGGGWNAVDDDLSMQPRFIKYVLNFRRTSSGSQKKRFGTKWKADISSAVTGTIVDMEYFNGSIIAVTNTGQIARVQENGTVTAIWSEAIASALPFAPAGWGTTFTTIDFVPFKSELILHNGVDKPVTIDSNFVVTYLQDLATGSNLNTPIGKYGCVASNYHCIAGITNAPTEIYISNSGTAGTFPGDVAPNDSISVDVGAYAPEGAAEIRGIAGFRNYLLVFFLGQTLVVTLGVYNSADVHVPEFPDTLPQFGVTGHRNIITLENDLVFGAVTGVYSAKRNLFSGQINSTALSALIEPEYVRDMDQLDEVEQLEKTFAVLDRISHDILFFTPEGHVYVYSSSEQLKYKAWSHFHFSNVWKCGCTSFLGRVFLAEGTRIFQMGNNTFPDEHFDADRLLDRDVTWVSQTSFTADQLVLDTVTGEVFLCRVSHTKPAGTFEADRIAHPDRWEIYEGLDINFELELPWLDGKDPMKLKNNKFISVGTQGNAHFTASVYVDQLYKDVEGTVIHEPALEMAFVGNLASGYGGDSEQYGGGRKSNSPRLYGFPVRFKMMKPVFSGASKRPLEIVTLSFLFAKGRYKR